MKWRNKYNQSNNLCYFSNLDLRKIDNFTAVLDLIWVKVIAWLKLNILKKLNRTQSCEDPGFSQAGSLTSDKTKRKFEDVWILAITPSSPHPKEKFDFKSGKIHIIIGGGDGRWSFLWQAPVRCSERINTGRFANSQSAKTSDRHSRRPGWGNIYHLWQRIEKVTSAGQVIKVTSVRSCHISLWRLQLCSPQAPIHKLLDESVG